jgi:hypothetical protein
VSDGKATHGSLNTTFSPKFPALYWRYSANINHFLADKFSIVLPDIPCPAGRGANIVAPATRIDGVLHFHRTHVTTPIS